MYIFYFLSELESASVLSDEIYNCETGKTGNKITTCGICSSDKILSRDKSKCLSKATNRLNLLI